MLDEQLVTELPYDGKDMLGITSNQIRMPGMVPLYEEHLVRTNLRYTIEQWYTALSPIDRAFEVAIWRIGNAIEYQKNKAQEREMKASARKNKG